MNKLIFLFTLFAFINVFASELPYDESADAKAAIKQAQAEAKATNLPLIIVFGANWCEDCRALSAAIKTGKNSVKLSKEFKIVKVNVGNFDRNIDIANSYGNPIKVGIPGAAILSPEGSVLYITKAGELASARSMSDDGIYEFFKKASKAPKSNS